MMQDREQLIQAITEYMGKLDVIKLRILLQFIKHLSQ